MLSQFAPPVSTVSRGLAPILPGDATKYLDGSGNYTVPVSTEAPNFLINGDLGIWARQTATTFTAPSYKGATITTAADGYSADRWKVATQSATVPNAKQVDTMGAQEAGLRARLYGQLKALATSKMVWYQILEGTTTYGLDGQVVTVQVVLKASSAKTIRLGVIQLTSSGTVDVIPAALVPTTWGADTTDPTLGSNLSYIAPTSVPTGAQGTVNGNAVDCAVTTAWQTFALTFTVPATAKNLIVAVWTDSQFSNGDILSASQWLLTLTPAPTLPVWAPRDIQQETQRCYRFCRGWRGFSAGQETGWHGPCALNATSCQLHQNLGVPLRAAPTLAISGTADFQVGVPGIATPSISALTYVGGNPDLSSVRLDATNTSGSGTNTSGTLQAKTTSATLVLDADL